MESLSELFWSFEFWIRVLFEPWAIPALYALRLTLLTLVFKRGCMENKNI